MDAASYLCRIDAIEARLNAEKQHNRTKRLKGRLVSQFPFLYSAVDKHRLNRFQVPQDVLDMYKVASG